MNAIDIIKFSLKSIKNWAMALLDDIQDEPLVQPTPNGGNHPLWIIGHLALGESNLLDGFILGQPNRFPELEAMFGMGSTPVVDADKYPSMEELYAKFEAIRAASLAHLDTLSEADLDRPSHAPAEFGEFFGTVGACYAAMSNHVSFHTGQVADVRRAAGRKLLMV